MPQSEQIVYQPKSLFFKGFLILLVFSTASIVCFQGIAKESISDIPPLESSKHFSRGVVTSSDKKASTIGANILRKGGNAIDAAVATAYALAVLEPNGSGLGGGGFALVYLANNNKTFALDFRERAPLNINKTSNIEGNDFKNGPKAAGVPGTLKGLDYLTENYGRLNRKELLAEAIEYAEQGFDLEDGSRLKESIGWRQSTLSKYESSAKVFLDKSSEEPSSKIVQKQLAETLKIISKQGAQAFYNGELTQPFLVGINAAGGFMNQEDLANYKVYELEPVCGKYRNKKLCSFPLPSSGGICLIEALNILENFKLENYDYNDPERWHYAIEALKFAFTDRATELGDEKFENIQWKKLINKNYGKELAELINQKGKAYSAKEINELKGLSDFPKSQYESEETTSFTVSDREGNIVVITSSLNGPLGSGFVEPNTGILMNNTLNDFSLPGKANMYGLIANPNNYPKPSKTPLSSMSPTIIFDEVGKPILGLGSPGGPTIISAVLNTILAYLDQEMSLEDSVKATRVHHQYVPDTTFFEDYFSSENEFKNLQATLNKKYKHSFPKVNKQFYWAVQAVELDYKSRKIKGVSDPRRGYSRVVYE